LQGLGRQFPDNRVNCRDFGCTWAPIAGSGPSIPFNPMHNWGTCSGGDKLCSDIDFSFGGVTDKDTYCEKVGCSYNSTLNSCEKLVKKCIASEEEECVECTSNSHCVTGETCCGGECIDPKTEACCGLMGSGPGLVPDCRERKTKGPGGEVCIDGCYIAGANTECKAFDFDYASAGYDNVATDGYFRIVGENSILANKFNDEECEPLHASGKLDISAFVCTSTSSCSQQIDDTISWTTPTKACSFENLQGGQINIDGEFFTTGGGWRGILSWGEDSIKASIYGGLEVYTRYNDYKVWDGTYRYDGEGRGRGRGDGGGRGEPTPNMVGVTNEEMERIFIFMPGLSTEVDFGPLGAWDAGFYLDAVSLWEGDVKAAAALRAKQKILGFDSLLYYEHETIPDSRHEGEAQDIFGIKLIKLF